MVKGDLGIDASVFLPLLLFPSGPAVNLSEYISVIVLSEERFDSIATPSSPRCIHKYSVGNHTDEKVANCLSLFCPGTLSTNSFSPPKISHLRFRSENDDKLHLHILLTPSAVR